MAAAVGAVRDGLKAMVETITNLRCHDTVPDQLNPPCAVVIPEAGQPRTVTGNRDTQEYRVKLVVSRTVEDKAQDKLDGFIASSGSTSLRAALAANQTLGISGVKAVWMGWQNYGAVEWPPGVYYFGVDVLITVHT